MRNEVALIYGRIKNKVRNMLYELFLWKYGFGNRVSKVTWEKQFSSGSWAHLFNPQESAHYTSIARMVKNQDLSVKILDVGCGQGVLYGYLQKDNQSINYLGIDISNEAISQAKEKFKGKRFQNLDFENNTISEKFDIIIFNETLYYFNRPIKTIASCIKKNLNLHGKLIISMCDYKGHDVIWSKLGEKYNFIETEIVENKMGQCWKVVLMEI